jgi:hypothetical protein
MSGYDPRVLYSGGPAPRAVVFTPRDADRPLEQVDWALAKAWPELGRLRVMEVASDSMPPSAYTQIFSRETYANERVRADRNWPDMLRAIHNEMLLGIGKTILETLFSDQIPRIIHGGGGRTPEYQGRTPEYLTRTGGLRFYMRRQPDLVFPQDFRLIAYRHRLHQFVSDYDPRQDGSTIILRHDIGLAVVRGS